MAKNILLILGHPSENSFCNALLDAYLNSTETAGAVCMRIYISQLKGLIRISLTGLVEGQNLYNFARRFFTSVVFLKCGGVNLFSPFFIFRVLN